MRKKNWTPEPEPEYVGALADAIIIVAALETGADMTWAAKTKIRLADEPDSDLTARLANHR